jgi:hypothetical protein
MTSELRVGLEGFKVEIPEWVRGRFPDAPVAFVREPDPDFGPWVYRQISKRRMTSMHVICTGRVEADGRRWLHVSASRFDRVPDWYDLKLVKQTFLPDVTALQVLPTADKYVNVNPNVLHLWACVDGDVVPDFRIRGQI